MNITKEFIPYTEALSLKELEFDEPCLATTDQTDYLHINGTENSPRGSMMYNTIDCPTFSQSFRFFREKYGLEGEPQRAEDFIWYKWTIHQYNENGKKYVADWYEYKTYEEAELACLKKLIEIVQTH